MARRIGNLTSIGVRNLAKPGLYGDGGGLYLQVGPTGAKSWIFRFMLSGRARTMGLGPIHTISLAEARNLALECRKQRLEGKDPIELRKEKRAPVDVTSVPTFLNCADAYIKAHEVGWRNDKHVSQWRASLQTYAGPVFGKLPIDQVDLGMVMQVLEPIWGSKTETASRVRGRIEAVLDWAKVRGYRSGENPARWRGHLEALLPARSRVKKVKHHSALPYAELPAFMKSLGRSGGSAARALEFLILTAARTGEVIGARWNEIDLANRVWVVPAERMKARKEHRVPLTNEALAVIGSAPDDKSLPLFIGPNGKSPLSNMAMLVMLKRMERTDITIHGFRSTFRDWVAEKTEFPRELAEMALAHTIESKVEAAYRRGDMFERRRQLMEAWSSVANAYWEG